MQHGDGKPECYQEIVRILGLLGEYGHGLTFPTGYGPSHQSKVQEAVREVGPMLRQAVSNPHFDPEECLSLHSHDRQMHDEYVTECKFAWGGYRWEENWTLRAEYLILKGMDGKTLRGILEAKIPELLEFHVVPEVPVVTIHAARELRGLALTFTNMEGDTIARFPPSLVKQLKPCEFKDRLLPLIEANRVEFVLPDGSRLPDLSKLKFEDLP
eukprot:TRINITY_DN6983_c0_g1_i1.p1 TRINITY_DN6983_c0_g1~~TRINITY_DN6983_c0_g1_i1.p1  ORF type:complete len:228 (+),score=35.86 TRINITY_DN6983_c0_g1_i1:48-686(+)